MKINQKRDKNKQYKENYDVMNLKLNKLKCGDYSFLFSMRMDDDGQHFN